MSSSAAESKKEEKPKRTGMKMKWKILLILFTLLSMAFLRTGFVFILIAMLPSIVVYYIDQSEHRYTFRSIFYCNCSGLLPYLAKLIKWGPTSGNLQEIMDSGSTWVIIYGAAFIGYLLTAAAPLVAQIMIGSLNQTQVRGLQRAQKKIEKEWGTEVTKFGVEKH